MHGNAGMVFLRSMTPVLAALLLTVGAASAHASGPPAEALVKEFLLGVGYDLVADQTEKSEREPLERIAQLAGYARSEALSITSAKRVGSMIAFEAKILIPGNGHADLLGRFGNRDGKLEVNQIDGSGAQFHATLFHRGRHATVDVRTADPAFMMKVGPTGYHVESYLAPRRLVRTDNIKQGLLPNAHRGPTLAKPTRSVHTVRAAARKKKLSSKRSRSSRPGAGKSAKR